jgi:glyoxylase-like metal-dependent hydrolase (beta-lactamase superfamily II)
MGLSDSVPVLSFEEFRVATKIDRTLVESDTFKIDDDLLLRNFASPGHTGHSVSYMLVPHEFVIADETFGYYQGKRLSAPGGDMSVTAALHSMQKVKDLELSGIGLPYIGALTGGLVRKHLEAVAQNTHDLFLEARSALAEGVSADEVRAQIKDAFYAASMGDPCLIESLDRSFEAVWSQIGASKEAPELPQNSGNSPTKHI